VAYLVELFVWAWVCWGAICLIRAHRDRIALKNKYYVHATGINETRAVWTPKHALYLMFFRNPIQLYGPYIQSDTKLTNFDRRWWKVYHQVYQILDREQKRLVRKAMFKIGFTLEGAIEHVTRIDVDLLIGEENPYPVPPAFSMLAAASEYEEIISMQESVK